MSNKNPSWMGNGSFRTGAPVTSDKPAMTIKPDKSGPLKVSIADREKEQKK